LPNSKELLARIGTLEQLLEVYERTVLEQSDKLLAEQTRVRVQNTLLECQGEASPDGILSVSTAGRVLFANSRLGELWGIPHPVIGTKTFDAVLHAMADRAEDPDRFRANASTLGSSEVSREEVVLKDGRTFDRYTAPVVSRHGDHFGRVWYFRDVSESKRMNRIKDEFISTVSHELRTPLTSIRGSLGLVVGGVTGSLPTEAMSLIRTAQANCERLELLINDILDIEKIEAGRMDFALRPLKVEPLLEQSIESMRSYGEQFGVSFRLSEDAPGAMARVDPYRLIQVMANLLSNAAKFSPPDRLVRVHLSRRGRDLRISVQDQGKGIPAELRKVMFEKFARAQDSRHTHQGTGLGLNIARAIVQRLGGQIGFESRPGATTFYFDLPEWTQS
jgi:PAS domain S-box-containing protein